MPLSPSREEGRPIVVAVLASLLRMSRMLLHDELRLERLVTTLASSLENSSSGRLRMGGGQECIGRGGRIDRVRC